MWKISIGIGIYTNINVPVWSSTGEPFGKEDSSKKDDKPQNSNISLKRTMTLRC